MKLEFQYISASF